MKKKIRFLCWMFICQLLIGGMSISLVANAEEDDAGKDTRKYLGEITYSSNGDGYNYFSDMDKDDPHYGWDIGDFYISGFTRVIDENTDQPIFLKNVGDDVRLSFVLKQDIDNLPNEETILKIASDKDGYDKYFKTEQGKFGKGMLFVGFTDYEGKKHYPIKHEDYLKNVGLNADTEVQICEEGDYEVALDYEIEKDTGMKFWEQGTFNYKIFFKFSVRNGNCMFYPFDVKTNDELTNSATTENGFYIDFAKSRYLDINVKKQIFKQESNELVEDTRFNRPASDGEKYTDEGVYIITAKNRYTDQTTEKTIYVGENKLLKAYAVNHLSLPEIQQQIDDGAVINEDGTIEYKDMGMKKVSKDDTKVTSTNSSNKSEETTMTDFEAFLAALLSIALWVFIICKIFGKRKKKK